MDKPVVAIAGSTGHLGKYITNAILNPENVDHFSEVILLSRQPPSSSQILSIWEGQGATIRTYDENSLSSAITDVDILINAIGSGGSGMKHKLVEALPSSKVNVYVPSEFGVDHTVHDFSHPEWKKKQSHVEHAKELKPDLKICRIYTGLFLEQGVGPWFGFNTKESKYESVGSADSTISFTGMADIGKAVAKLAVMPKEDIPDVVRLGGDNISIREIASIMERAGAGKIAITELALQPYKEETLQDLGGPANALRFLMGEGKINHTKDGMGNDNELVNPGERYWKWKKMADLAKEKKGKPWANQ